MRTSIRSSQPGAPELRITRIGFAGWAVDGDWAFDWGQEESANSIASIRHALDAGDDWIDTSAAQRVGDSHDGDGSLSDSRSEDRHYVFTKCGLIFDEGTRTGESRRAQWPAAIRQRCETSLRRLGIERVDLYELRLPTETDAAVQEALSATRPTLGAHRTGLIWYSTTQADLLTETLSRLPRTASAVAIAWTLTARGVVEAIVGAGAADQIESWIDAVTLVLTRANLGEIVTAIGRTGAGHSAQLPATLAA